MKNFVMIGAGGYIAPRHMKAIKDTGNNLLAALDKHDSVSILDSYFPEADFFIEFERFDRHIDKLRRQGIQTDFVTVCTPNYLHDAHIRFGLRIGADVICEKPLVLNPWNLDALMEIEKETGNKVYTLLQLRLHPAVIALKQKVNSLPKEKKFDVHLSYISARGNWYRSSWKGDTHKSGGIATNIGLHFFDMLIWIFGEVKNSRVKEHGPMEASGELELERANVNWDLSIDAASLPEEIKKSGQRSFRSLTLDGEPFDFSNGFTELHTLAYQEILDGRGFLLEENIRAIQLVHQIRNAITA